jgi:hypothetical protein
MSGIVPSVLRFTGLVSRIAMRGLVGCGGGLGFRHSRQPAVCAGVLCLGRAAVSTMCLGRGGWGRPRDGGDHGGHLLSLRIGVQVDIPRPSAPPTQRRPAGERRKWRASVGGCPRFADLGRWLAARRGAPPGRGSMCAYCAVMPPSITSSEPVTQDDSSDARNSTPLAISSAVPSRPIGVRSSSTWRTAGSLKRCSVIGVSA